MSSRVEIPKDTWVEVLIGPGSGFISTNSSYNVYMVEDISSQTISTDFGHTLTAEGTCFMLESGKSLYFTSKTDNSYIIITGD